MRRNSRLLDHVDEEVRVYYNLRKKKFSVQVKTEKGWRVLDHADAVRLNDAKFVVQPSGPKRVRARGRKDVHAYVQGKLFGFRLEVEDPRKYHFALTSVGNDVIIYNPYKYDQFVWADDRFVVQKLPHTILFQGKAYGQRRKK